MLSQEQRKLTHIWPHSEGFYCGLTKLPRKRLFLEPSLPQTVAKSYSRTCGGHQFALQQHLKTVVVSSPHCYCGGAGWVPGSAPPHQSLPPTLSVSVCHSAVSQCTSVTVSVSHYHSVTVSQCHSFTLSQCTSVTVSHYHSVTVSHQEHHHYTNHFLPHCHTTHCWPGPISLSTSQTSVGAALEPWRQHVWLTEPCTGDWSSSWIASSVTANPGVKA